jgi:hypothetical protein
MKKFLVMLLLSTFVMSFSASAFALEPFNDNSFMRCNNGLVTIGEKMGDVLTKCGKPVHREDVGRVFNGYTTDVQQDWTYNRGPTSFLYTLKFAGDHLMEISRGSRGY